MVIAIALHNSHCLGIYGVHRHSTRGTLGSAEQELHQGAGVLHSLLHPARQTRWRLRHRPGVPVTGSVLDADEGAGRLRVDCAATTVVADPEREELQVREAAGVARKVAESSRSGRHDQGSGKVYTLKL